jgi:hypothetical protein
MKNQMTTLSENFEIKNLLFLQKKLSELARSIYQYYGNYSALKKQVDFRVTVLGLYMLNFE